MLRTETAAEPRSLDGVDHSMTLPLGAALTMTLAVACRIALLVRPAFPIVITTDSASTKLETDGAQLE
jgi:hypothetical protein